jgi:nucleotide-binding universal stress UspA family protein
MSESRIRTILLPVDGSELSFKAAEYAIRIARIEKASIIALHVIGIPLYIPEYRGKILYPAYFDEAGKIVAEWMQKIVEMAREANVEVKKEIVIDMVSIIDAITRYAKKQDADLIVMGTTGRTGLKKFLLGSVAYGVMTHAHCPVLIVR